MILAQYIILKSFSLGLIILLFFCFVYFISYKRILINKWIFYFIVSCMFSQIFIHKSFFGILTFIVILIAMSLLNDKINEDQLLKYWKVFGTIAIIGLVYQSILTYIFKLPVSPIKIIPLESAEANLNWAMDLLRPSSFFAEPQAFATFMMPFLFLTLKKNQYGWSIFITFAVLLSTSSQGIIMMVILWLGFLIFTDISNRYKFIIFFTFITFIALYLYLPFFEISRAKLFQTEILGNPRLSRGFEIFFHLSNKEKLLGIGYGNVGDYVYNIRDSFIWGIGNSREKLNYTSGFSGLMVQFGLMNTFLFLFIFVKIWRDSLKINRTFLILILAASFSQNILLNAWFIYLFLFYLGISYRPEKINYLTLKFHF